MCSCALCCVHACNGGSVGKNSEGCPHINDDTQEIKDMYKKEEIFNIARQSTLCVEAGYGIKTRLEEIMDFAGRCEYKNLGLAFCIGLANESKILSKVLCHNGFTVNSIICKNGAISKEFVGLTGATVSMCNPIGQAIILNEAKTDFNILLGLCVGHDSLFIKYSEAPVTVFVVKDRVLAHNPLGAIYQADSYYKDRLFPDKTLF